jgi:hypothetical protein
MHQRLASDLQRFSAAWTSEAGGCLRRRRRVRPSYRSLQDSILAAIGQFRARQMTLVEAHLPKDLAAEIDLLLDEKEETDGITRSRLAVLKQNSQSVRPMAVKARLANHTDLSKLFQRLELPRRVHISAILGNRAFC